MKETELKWTKHNQSLSFFIQCVHSCGEPIMITDTKGVLTYVNPAWTQTYGYNCAEALGSTPRILRSAHQDSEFYHQMWASIKDPHIEFWKGELTNCRKDGTEVPVMLTISPVKDDTHTTTGYIGIALDLTEEKKLRLQVEQQDRLATIGTLTSSLAHEIGTPIGVIRGRAELLLMDVMASPEKLKKNLNIIIEQTDRISKFIHMLLNLSRHKDEQLTEKINIKTVTNEVLELLSPQLRKSQIQMHQEIPENLTLCAEKGRLEQVLINLIHNSIHAIEKKRWDKNHPTEEGAIYLLGQNKDSQMIITVKDNGCGIAPSHKEKIFEPFFTTKSTGQGTGLGLSITRRIVNEMGGSICFESQEGRGSSFLIKFPYVPS